jgi:hypothetical protein
MTLEQIRTFRNWWQGVYILPEWRVLGYSICGIYYHTKECHWYVWNNTYFTSRSLTEAELLRTDWYKDEEE